jgi:hypothetical protein
MHHQMRTSVEALNLKGDFMDAKEEIEKILADGKTVSTSDLKRLKDLAGYKVKNWKKVLPTILALGVAGYFAKNRGKKTANAAKKPAAKKTAAKSGTKAKKKSSVKVKAKKK